MQKVPVGYIEQKRTGIYLLSIYDLTTRKVEWIWVIFDRKTALNLSYISKHLTSGEDVGNGETENQDFFTRKIERGSGLDLHTKNHIYESSLDKSTLSLSLGISPFQDHWYVGQAFSVYSLGRSWFGQGYTLLNRTSSGGLGILQAKKFSLLY